MNELNKKDAVEAVLKKRFGVETPEEVENIVEINIFDSLDEESPLGIGVELILEGDIKEEYQINSQGIIYSWGNSPVIDERSLKNSPIN